MKMLAGLSIPTQGKIFFYGKTGENELANARKSILLLLLSIL